MKNPLRYMSFEVAAFLNDEAVVSMTAAERGVYISLLCWAWSEGSIPDDPGQASVFVRLDKREVTRAWPVLRKRFNKRDDGRLYHERLERDRIETIERVSRRREAGRQGGLESAKSRRRDDDEGKHCLSNAQAEVEASIKQTSSIVKQQQEKDSNKKDSINKNASSEADAVDFSSRNQEDDDEEALSSVLTHAGVSASKSRDLARRYPGRIRDQVRWIEHRDRIKNRPAALITAIEENWPKPDYVDYLLLNGGPADLMRDPAFYGSLDQWLAARPSDVDEHNWLCRWHAYQDSRRRDKNRYSPTDNIPLAN